MKPLNRERMLKTRNILAEDGIEMTPDEVEKKIKSGLKHFRENMRARGHSTPDSDEDLILLLEKILEPTPSPPEEKTQ